MEEELFVTVDTVNIRVADLVQEAFEVVNGVKVVKMKDENGKLVEFHIREIGSHLPARQVIFCGHDPYKGFEPLPHKDQGWNSYVPIFKEVIDEIKPKRIIEVGSWMGLSAIHMTKLAKEHHSNVEVICVDTFLGAAEMWTDPLTFDMQFKFGRPVTYDHFLSNVIHEGLQDNIIPLPLDSLNASQLLHKYRMEADLIYIDAAHDYESVNTDLYHWSQLLRPGGILLGDDWHHEPVQRAARDVLGEVEGHIYKVGEMGKFVWRKPMPA